MKSSLVPSALVAATVALVVTGCSFNGTGANANSGQLSKEEIVSQAPIGFESYYSQEISWGACNEDDIVLPLASAPKDMDAYQCANVSVPMNWDDPNSAPIELSVARYAPGRMKSAPALFYNLGGPGGGAVNSITAVAASMLSEDLVKHFQIVAVDPRGVGGSTPIWCMTDEERDEELSREEDLSGLTTDQLVALADEETAKIGQQCLERNGEVLGYVDTDSATRDFDVVRALMGQKQFDYIGFSYGTVIGAYYAELFPERVGNLVLDGAVDPSLSINELSAAQVKGMELSLYNWLEVCLDGTNCPFTGDLDSAKEQLTDFLEGLADEPLRTSDPERPLTESLAYTAIIGSLYSTDMFSLLTQGVSQAFGGDGSTLLFLADYFNSRGEDGVYTDNSADAFLAINSLDYEPVGTPEEWQAQADDLAERFPIVASDFGLASAGMGSWPVESRIGRHKITAPGTPPILVIGTTNDPATPYFMAENLARDLESGVLLTVEGWNHTAYSLDADECIRKTVDDFLIDGTVPEESLVCPG